RDDALDQQRLASPRSPPVWPRRRSRPARAPSTRPSPEGRDPAEALSKLHDLGFFFFEKRVDLGHVTIGEFLNLVLRAALVILRDELLLQQVLEMAQCVAAHIADRDARVLALVPNRAHDLLAPLLGHGPS